MNKLEFFKASICTGLRVHIIDNHKPNLSELEILRGMFDDYYVFTNNDEHETFTLGLYNAVVRHISDLTRECSQYDYNNGKPFVPIVELRKLYPCYDFSILMDNNKSVIGFDNINMDNDMIIEDVIQIIQQLLHWHFNLMDESEDVIYVTDEFNPYK